MSFHVDLPDLDSTRGAVLMFKVSGNVGSHLRMVNHPAAGSTETVIDFKLDDTFTKPRSWHEIVQGSQFSEANKLMISVAASPAGQKVIVSDVVLLYHAHTP
jgi:hypothetical protein